MKSESDPCSASLCGGSLFVGASFFVARQPCVLVSVRGQDVIVPVAEDGFPTSNCEGHDAFQFVVSGPVRQIHPACEQSKAAGGVCGGPAPGLHKRTRQWIHFIEAGIRKSLLRGESISSQ